MQLWKHPITPRSWFDTHAGAATYSNVSAFPDSSARRIPRYGNESKEFHGKELGSVMFVEFKIDCQPFVVLNVGPIFKFNEAISLQVQ
jgi:predicted 3-demethylubiquinone-9 3-methyltransferase (glyoxalase superfamily)